MPYISHFPCLVFLNYSINLPPRMFGVFGSFLMSTYLNAPLSSSTMISFFIASLQSFVLDLGFNGLRSFTGYSSWSLYDTYAWLF